MLRRGALVRTDVSEELGSSFIRVTRIGELGATLVVTSNRSTLSQYYPLTYTNTVCDLGNLQRLCLEHAEGIPP
jgi:hypothetical protein